MLSSHHRGDRETPAPEVGACDPPERPGEAQLSLPAPHFPHVENWDMAPAPAAWRLLFRDSEDRESPTRRALSFLIISRSEF